MKLSEHFTEAEFIRSDYATRHGIPNEMNDEQRENARNVCNLIEPLRVIIGKPFTITSGFRCPELNEAAGGAKKSQHLTGSAIDFRCDGMSVERLFQMAKVLPFDQLIQEFGGWVHVSWSDKPRRQIMRAVKVNGKTVYAHEQ